MKIFILTAGVMAFLMAIMAIGVIFSNRELKGSCGGVGNCACEKSGTDACERNKNKDHSHDELDDVRQFLQQQQS